MKTLLEDIRSLADKLCNTIGGNFNFVVPYEGNNPEMEKLHMITNFVLDTARRALDDATVTRKELEKKVEQRTQELQLEMKKAEGASIAKGHFLASVSHEMRTPLAALVGFADLLQNHKDVSEEIKLYLNIIHRNSQQVMHIINKVLDVSKIEAGQILLEYSVFDAHKIIEELLQNFHQRDLEDRHIELLSLVELHNVPDALIYTDRPKFIQVITNLIENALKYTKTGNITIELTITGSEKDRKAIVSVKDTGSGIPPEFVERIFTPFSRAEKHVKSAIPGVGLGLSLSHKLASALGGHLALTHTEIGVGTTFSLTINQTKEDLHQVYEKRMQRHKFNKSPETSFHDLKVLVVEDFDENRFLLKKYLENAGATVETATNGLEALHKTEIFSPDIILMDLQMPIMDGYEATQKLRETGFKAPIVAVTAFALKDEMERSLRSGFDDHLTKPLDSQRLFSCIERLNHAQH